jgi:lactate racemase
MSASHILNVCEKQVLRTGAWYGDDSLELEFPRGWEVNMIWPRTPPALAESQIADALESPIGQPPLREMCRGARRPLVIIDDVNRPTPVDQILPHILRHFRDAGILPQKVTILLATGTHGRPHMESVLNKVGPEGSMCRIVVHDAKEPAGYLGRTRFGTPVFANKEVVASDFLIGVGGFYPNHSAGYGGGSKLALGVLGFRSILHLHYFHSNAGWGLAASRNTFRDDLNEIAGMLRIQSMVSVHVNAERKPIRVSCGDYLAYYEQEVAFARRIFAARPPQDADVVISNAYPNDLSLTFALMKGAAPLHKCKPSSSRVLLASCTEGAGNHALFPVVNASRLHIVKNYMQLTRTMGVIGFARRASAGIRKKLRVNSGVSRAPAKRVFNNPIWIYRVTNARQVVLPTVAGVKISSSWSDILEAISQEQGRRQPLKVVIYPCAPLVSLANQMNSSVCENANASAIA